MVILGGLGSIWGVVLGAIVLSFINNYLIPDVLNGVPGKLGLDFDLTQITFGDLRLPARDHDDPAPAGPAARSGGTRWSWPSDVETSDETLYTARA